MGILFRTDSEVLAVGRSGGVKPGDPPGRRSPRLPCDYRFKLTSSVNTSSAVVIIRAEAWNPR